MANKEVEAVLNCLDKLNLGYKFGIAGSYARGTAKKRSDIDIVVDGTIEDMGTYITIEKAVKENFNRKCDILCLPLLKEEDKRLDALLISMGLSENKHSAYKNIVREVIWHYG